LILNIKFIEILKTINIYLFSSYRNIKTIKSTLLMIYFCYL